ncbi:hypothetical protein DPMN_025255 [Dreissena polymorpha]|uniref:Uncharacterized protein n=1 Tax=Dreissena polymorpha TaxID=45954 RepID=A0A9D4RBP2_DREPO|nr:hypothetical protein DPMN_025255 [Dreissena polymorpha]
MWLPASQPPHCKIIVSSLPEENYETFPVLKDRYIHVPELDQRDAHSIVALWAQKRNRTLTQTQMELLLTTFRKCPTPLFLKTELDDVLSCDDDVLNDVFTYWTPPMRRLPPLILVLIRTDIDQYIGIEPSDDFTAAKAAFQGDSLLKNILEALLLSRTGLQTDPVQFVPQLLGRLEDNECRPRLAFGSGATLSANDITSGIDMVTMTSCGKYVITVCEEEEEIKIWIIKVDPPRLLRNVTGKAQCRKVALCHGDEWIAMKLGNGIKVEVLHTGRVPLGHQDALFVTGSAGEDSPNIVGVYNVGRLEYRAIRELVRRRVLFRSLLIKVACNANMRFYEADNRSVVMEIYDKFYLFDLEKMDVSIVFSGRVVDTRVCILTKRKQLLVASRFGKNVKRYNITNGCIDAIIKTGHKKEIYQVVVNDPGTLAAVTVVCGPVVLMEPVTHSRMYEISNSTFRRCESIFTSQN